MNIWNAWSRGSMKDLIYRNNIDSLIKRYPKYAEAISSCTTNDSGSMRIKVY